MKEIADVCEIHKNLSTHTARHSYATSICLANSVSMENVAKMLIHDAEVAEALGIACILYAGGHNSLYLLSGKAVVVKKLNDMLSFI